MNYDDRLAYIRLREILKAFDTPTLAGATREQVWAHTEDRAREAMRAERELEALWAAGRADSRKGALDLLQSARPESLHLITRLWDAREAAAKLERTQAAPSRTKSGQLFDAVKYDERYEGKREHPPKNSRKWWDRRADDDVQWSIRMPKTADEHLRWLSAEWWTCPEVPHHARLGNTLRRVIAIGLSKIDQESGGARYHGRSPLFYRPGSGPVKRAYEAHYGSNDPQVDCDTATDRIIRAIFSDDGGDPGPDESKLTSPTTIILAGLLIGSLISSLFGAKSPKKSPRTA